MSDIVFLRAWYPVRPHRFYNPVTNLLESGDADAWNGMRLTGQVRAEQNIPTPKERNSAYRPVERQERHFNPLRVHLRALSLVFFLPFLLMPGVAPLVVTSPSLGALA